MTKEQESLRIQQIEKIKEALSKSKQLMILQGAFGDEENCSGIVEKVIHPEEGGELLKFYGCTYLFKGLPPRRILEGGGLGLAKSMISAIPREIIAPSFTLKLALAFLYVFSRRRFIHYCNVYFGEIYRNVVLTANFPPQRYNAVARELRRAMENTIGFEIGNKEEQELLMKVGAFVSLFIELDAAYRFPLQDIFGGLEKERVKKSARQEVRWLFDILLERTNFDVHRQKWIQFSKAVMFFLLISLKACEFLRSFLLELDIDKVKLDENDWYFCLQRRSYNFGGVSFEDRMKERKRLDEEKGHIIIKFGKEEVARANGQSKVEENK